MSFGDGSRSANICNEWFYDTFNIFLLEKFIAIAILLINTILKSSIIFLVKFIKEDTISAQMSSIQIGIFLTQYLNTAIILLLVGANFKESNINILKDLFQGEYTDFNS